MSLEDVTELIERPSPFSDEETSALISLAAELLEIGLKENPMQYIQPTFPNELCADVLDLLQQQVEYVLPLGDQIVVIELEEIISMALQMVYISVAPARSEPRQKDASSLKDVQVFAITKIIAALRATPQPDQRTTEWYEFRYRYVTASSIWKAFFSESSRNQLICDKCKPLDAGKYTAGGQSLESPMHWGHKYEPVSIQLYEEQFKTQVSDFGCLPHPTISFLAASPDGINTLANSPLYGRMLEVKNIVNREIDGIPKLEYWIQMQMQMEVCGLDESDFLETRFKEYADYDEFVNDNDGSMAYNKSRLGELKGQIILFMKEGQQPFYVYAPLVNMLSKNTALLWEDSVMQEYADLTCVKNIYWRLDQLSCVLVKRNRLWCTAALPILEKLWIDIQHDKVHGFSHRLPQKRTNILQIDTEVTAAQGMGCLINVDNIFD